jgi:hypothetical protein
MDWPIVAGKINDKRLAYRFGDAFVFQQDHNIEKIA